MRRQGAIMVLEAVKSPVQQNEHDVAVVDDDPLFLETFAANLRAGGYRVRTFTSTKAILAGWFEGLRPVAILVEARAAARDHGALPRALRSVGFAGPIVLLTPEEPRNTDRTTEWIAKTLPPATFLRELGRVVRNGSPDTASLSVGVLDLNVAAGQAIWKGRALPLGRSELALAALLVQRAGITVGYRELFQAVQADLFVANGGGENYRMLIRAAVERMRQKFLAADPQFAAIEHHAGIGYRWRT
jgi:DNA-binding response OmpR family regulator